MDHRVRVCRDITRNGSFAGYIGSAVDVTERRRPTGASTVNQRLIEAQEEERARLARELHDDVNQRLVAVEHGSLMRWRGPFPPATDGRQKIEEARKRS